MYPKFELKFYWNIHVNYSKRRLCITGIHIWHMCFVFYVCSLAENESAVLIIIIEDYSYFYELIRQDVWNDFLICFLFYNCEFLFILFGHGIFTQCMTLMWISQLYQYIQIQSDNISCIEIPQAQKHSFNWYHHYMKIL